MNAQDDADWTPLMIAVSVGSLEIVQKLLAKDADVMLPNSTHQIPLHYAASKNYLDVCPLSRPHFIFHPISTQGKITDRYCVIGKSAIDRFERQSLSNAAS